MSNSFKGTGAHFTQQGSSGGGHVPSGFPTKDAQGSSTAAPTPAPTPDSGPLFCKPAARTARGRSGPAKGGPRATYTFGGGGVPPLLATPPHQGASGPDRADRTAEAGSSRVVHPCGTLSSEAQLSRHCPPEPGHWVLKGQGRVSPVVPSRKSVPGK